MKKILLFLLIGLVSCSLFKEMRRNSFAYEEGRTLPLVVPKRFTNMELKKDSAGNRMQVFSYSGGGTLYFYHGDTTNEYFNLDTSQHISKVYPQNVLFFKGQDSSNGMFWRESRYKNFRFGYKNISTESEAWFDSAVNYAAWQLVAPVPKGKFAVSL